MRSHPALDNLFWLDRRWETTKLSREEAESFCRELAQRHYENFTVVSLLLPRNLRQHFSNVYAYCRIADDLADELGNREASLERLTGWRGHLDRCFEGDAVHPVFVALRETIRQFDIPKQPFADLLTAFLQDQTKSRYATWAEVLDYCRNSANPVGRLVLYLCGYRDGRRQELSDQTCTALQLTNFWQDVARDFESGRIYIPLELFEKYGYTEDMLKQKIANEAWAGLMRDLVDRTRPFFLHGLQLCPLVERRIRLDVELFSLGGLKILEGIERVGYDTLHHRPKLTKWSETLLIISALLRSLRR